MNRMLFGCDTTLEADLASCEVFMSDFEVRRCRLRAVQFVRTFWALCSSSRRTGRKGTFLWGSKGD